MILLSKLFCSLFILNKNKLLLALTLLLLIMPLSGFSQVQLTLQDPPMKRLKVSDLWNLQLNNPQNIRRNVYLIAEITDTKDDRRIARFRTNAFSLPAGLKRLDPQQINVTQKEFFDNQAEQIIQRTNNFPKGKYIIRVTLFNATDDSELGQASL